MPHQNRRAASVKELAISLGLAVERKALPRGLAGRLVPDAFSESGYLIEVNEKDNVRRQRFTVLHEIGHFILHSTSSDPFAPVSNRARGVDEYGIIPFYPDDGREREADECASAILFDHGALAAAESLFNGDLEKISKHFGVSVEVVKIGLRQFGLKK